MARQHRVTPTRAVMAAVLVALATAARAQSAPPPPTAQENLRHQIYLMEGVLARAVTSGAARLSQQFRSVMPDVVVMAGDANARGFQLDQYGVFFDVEVPVLRQSMMWSLRTMLEQDDQGASDALAALRTLVMAQTGPERAAAESALRRLEFQLRPFALARRGSPGLQGLNATAPAGATAAGTDPAGRSNVNRLFLDDPNKVYTETVVRALIEAIVDNALPMVSYLGPEAFLTVAARDNERRDLLAPPNPFEQVSTFTLRIRAADLAAYRAGTIDRGEAMKRVQVQEF
jgi:hypothetical protein